MSAKAKYFKSPQTVFVSVEPIKPNHILKYVSVFCQFNNSDTMIKEGLFSCGSSDCRHEIRQVCRRKVSWQYDYTQCVLFNFHHQEAVYYYLLISCWFWSRTLWNNSRMTGTSTCERAHNHLCVCTYAWTHLHCHVHISIHLRGSVCVCAHVHAWVKMPTIT